ncbi:acetoacetate decarboxylase family protein [Amycolatopsis sp. NPDC059021]|uniref:acetoacetate decarboxylase family protein n=1 Tax=Amycolatopsis sp. NPDC059021 TaxID=3346704 RepID=UPI00366F0982
MSDYPPEPWNLAGDAWLSVWRVPVSEIPALPEGARPLVWRGRATVVTAWIDYRPPGQLSYHELLATVAVHGRRAATSITGIWVDSETSLAGGRALWGIPKDLAAFEFAGGHAFTASAATGDDWIATAAFTPRLGLPFSIPAAFEVVQTLDGRLKRSPVASKAGARLASSDWQINPAGPLGHLAGHRPVASAKLAGFTLRFGG